jgi:poly-beta-1,6-N-acetyl-D-glucosamine biosynthesis protein PgaD
MTTRPPQAIWPPLVRPENISVWIRIRDGLITLFAWGLMAWLIRHELRVLIDYFRPPVFQLTRVLVPNWGKFWTQFGSFVIVSGVLTGWIVSWGIRRRRYLYRLPAGVEPDSLDLNEHARFWSMSPENILQAREARVIQAVFNEEGRLTSFGPVLD